MYTFGDVGVDRSDGARMRMLWQYAKGFVAAGFTAKPGLIRPSDPRRSTRTNAIGVGG